MHLTSEQYFSLPHSRCSFCNNCHTKLLANEPCNHWGNWGDYLKNSRLGSSLILYCTRYVRALAWIHLKANLFSHWRTQTSEVSRSLWHCADYLQSIDSAHVRLLRCRLGQSFYNCYTKASKTRSSGYHSTRLWRQIQWHTKSTRIRYFRPNMA